MFSKFEKCLNFFDFCPIFLTNEPVLSFLVLKKSTKAQLNPIILSKVITVTNDDNDNDNRQTDVVKTVFSHSGGLKTWRFDENWRDPILYKSNTFSDENVIKDLALNKV